MEREVLTPPWRPLTVRGNEPATDYDAVLSHEHVFLDLRCWLETEDPLYAQLKDQRVGPATVELVRRNPFACPDNLILDDMELAVGELGQLAQAARKPLLVDLTPDTLGRDTRRLAEVSARTGIDIIGGCGPYIDASWSEELRTWPVGKLADAMVEALTDPLHPAGVIGEIGTGSPITSAELKALEAAAEANRRTGAPLFVHLQPWHPEGTAVLDLLDKHGVDPCRVNLCHLDVRGVHQPGLLEDLLARGCYVSFDIWGDEFPYGSNRMPLDAERVRGVLQLVQEGYGDRLMHSHDVCTRTQLSAFGGAGYGHLPRRLPGWLREVGLTDAQVRSQLAGNALQFLGLA